MPAPIPEPGPAEEQPPGGAQWWGEQGWAWVEGSADAGSMPECGRPGPQPEPPSADGLPPGLDYAALVEGLAASGALGSDAEDQDAEFAEWQAAEAEGRLEPADPAAVAAVAVEHMPPGAAQAGWLEVAAGGMGRLDENALIGVTRGARQQQARAAATELSAVARVCAQTADADPKIGLRGDGRPARISRDALGQIEMALRLTHYGAEALADLAVTLTWRLPATLAALGSGRIDLYRAQLIVGATSALSQELARHVEKRILPGAGQSTAAQLRQRLAYAVIAADPEAAEERRQDAERRAEMRLYADDDQTATLLLTKLPQIEAAASFARVTALARARMAAGMPGSLNLHRAQVALGLLNGTLPPIPPAEGAPPDQPPPDPDPWPGDDPGPNEPDPGDADASDADPGLSDPGDADPCNADPGLSDPGEPDSGEPLLGPGSGCPGAGPSADRGSGDGRPAEGGASGGAAPGAGPAEGDDCNGAAPGDVGPVEGGECGGAAPGDVGPVEGGECGGAAPGDVGPVEGGECGGAAPGDVGPVEGGESSGAAPGEGRPAEGGESSGAAPGAPADGSWRDDLPAPCDEDAPPDDGLEDLPGDPEPCWDPAEDDDDLLGTGPAPAWPAPGEIPPGLARRDPGTPRDGRPVPGLLDVLLPWTTLAGLSERPGTLGWIGPITAAQARQLARVAEADPAAQWRVIVTNSLGQALAVTRIRRPRRGRGLARDGPAASGPGPPTAAGLVGRITLTVSQETVTQETVTQETVTQETVTQESVTQETVTAARQQEGGPNPAAGPARAPGRPAGIVAAALRAATRALARAQDLADQDAAAGGCAHGDESPAYRPPPRLREFVIARDVTCRNLVCGQPAWRADLDHTRPYDQHGRTCRCNLGGGCRRDHQLKQHPRWKLEQNRPGFFTWVTPAGRTYTTGPDTHPI